MTNLGSAMFERLDHLSALVVTGQDARTFLQGQLSFDIDRLASDRIELATCSSAQGRVQAVLWLIARTDSILLLLPTSIAQATATRLKKYILRAKVKIETDLERYRVFAALGTGALEPRAHVEVDGRSFIGWPGERVLAITDSTAGEPASADRVGAWRCGDIAAGLPQVYPETHEAFVAQMLNVDLLGGISFDKGCYTGQEIIARTHYRGAIKRRMFRFAANSTPPPPGTRIVVGEQHAGDVVDAVQTSAGCELLAVINLAQKDDRLQLSSPEAAVLEPLALPYPV